MHTQKHRFIQLQRQNKQTKAKDVRVKIKMCVSKCIFLNVNEFLVSKETVVLRRWERSKQKFGFIKRVDKG